MVRLLVTTPSTSERGPEFMEKALAAIHQAMPQTGIVSFEYGEHEGRIGLFSNLSDDLEQIVISPLIANYPQSVRASVLQSEIHPAWETWQATLTLSPDVFPLLRHAQFEDLANRSFADPIDGLLRAATPTSTLRCRIQISVSRTSSRLSHRAADAVRILNGKFLRHHHHIAH